jgi:peptidoglycan lytic transglycosylase A
VRGTNKSFVFFRITGLNVDTEPAGAQGVPLTPGRSIAVDRIHVYGTPFFIDAELPIGGPRTKDRFRRLMVSQDTGSAIIGPARADLYFGAGKDAGAIAGRIRQQGRFVMLLPRELDMIEAGRAMPLPRPKPEIPPEADKTAKPKADPKAKAKSDGKAKPAPAKPPEAKSKLKRTS